MDGLYVHYIDVGQGDAELIMTSDGKTVLIDSGTPESRTVLTGYLKEQGVKKIDYFVLTHPHADHIGGAAAVLDAFDVVNVIMTDAPTTTSTYKKVLQRLRFSVRFRITPMTSTIQASFSA